MDHITKHLKQELEKLEIKPNKRLGQNFLVSTSVHKKIIETANITPGDTVLEIGPGLGTLTEYIIRAGAHVIGVEKDGYLTEYLRSRFSKNNTTIVHNDILKFDPLAYGLRPMTYGIIGNIPYYLTARLLRTMTASWPKPKNIILMMQREVAEKITQHPPEMSILSVAVQYYTIPSRIAKISRESFYPKPDVDSTIVKFIPSERWGLHNENTKKFFDVVTAGFSQKRKKLINTLTTGLNISKIDIEKTLKNVDISPDQRAETLSIEDWERITIEVTRL